MSGVSQTQDCPTSGFQKPCNCPPVSPIPRRTLFPTSRGPVIPTTGSTVCPKGGDVCGTRPCFNIGKKLSPMCYLKGNSSNGYHESF